MDQSIKNGKSSINFLSFLINIGFVSKLGNTLKEKSEVDKITVKKQPYQLPSTNREFFPSFDASNFHKVVKESL